MTSRKPFEHELQLRPIKVEYVGGKTDTAKSGRQQRGGSASAESSPVERIRYHPGSASRFIPSIVHQTGSFTAGLTFMAAFLIASAALAWSLKLFVGAD